MNTVTSKARRTVTTTLVTLVLAAAFPTAGFAHSTFDLGSWKLNPSQSSFNPAPKTNTVTIERSAQAPNPAAGKSLVIADGKAYVASGTSRVQIGKNVRSKDVCSFRCQMGLPDPRRTTLTFTAVNPAGQSGNVLAYGKR